MITLPSLRQSEACACRVMEGIARPSSHGKWSTVPASKDRITLASLMDTCTFLLDARRVAHLVTDRLGGKYFLTRPAADCMSLGPRVGILERTNETRRVVCSWRKQSSMTCLVLLMDVIVCAFIVCLCQLRFRALALTDELKAWRVTHLRCGLSLP